MNPEISIIIPVYNVEKYISKCIESVLYQSLSNIEIVVVNDGSTDSSDVIIQEFVNRDNRIKYFKTENKGVSNARNVGIQNAISPYVIFLDSDDWLDQFTCEKTFKLAIENNADMVFWNFYRVFEDRNVEANPLFQHTKLFDKNQVQFLKRRICGMLNEEMYQTTQTDLYSMPWAKLIKKSIITDNQIIFVDRKIVGSEDTLFNFLLFQKLENIVYCNEPLNYYRQDNPNSVTKTDLPFLMPRFLNLFAEIRNYIKSNNLDIVYLEALNNRIALTTIGVNLFVLNKRNSTTLNQKLNLIKQVLFQKEYVQAFKQLKLKYLPVHWKLFFWFCKIQSVLGVYLLSQCMRLLRNNE